jgi:hypothetical protein
MRRALLLLLLLVGTAHAQTWTRIATENQTFTVPTAQTVRYGAGTQWVERLVSGTGQCSNAFFGSDPAKMTVKACETLSAAPTPPPVQTPAPRPPPACWPAQVGGSGTPAKTVVVEPSDAARATPGTTAPVGSEAVHVLWWYCAAPLEPTGWMRHALMCAQSKLTECILSVPSLLPAALTTAWQASPPKHTTEIGLGWASTAFAVLHDKPPPAPPAEAWVVAKAAANANPAGTRPAFILLNGTLVDLYPSDRVREGDPCDCNKASLLRSTTRYCQTGTRDDKVAVCVKR